MKVLFAGSPETATGTLQAIVDRGHTVVGVLTQPAKPVGRKRVLTPTPVALLAERLGLLVATPNSAAEVLDQVRAWQPDVAIVVAYGRILNQAALDAIAGGWWNVHFSLLPRWRGATPVQHALLAGDSETGVTLFRIVPELDAGPIASTLVYPIQPDDTAQTLLSALAQAAQPLVLSLLDERERGEVVTAPQVGEPSFAPKLASSEGALDPSQPSEQLYARYRAVTPEPGAFLIRADDGSRVKLLGAHLDPTLDSGLGSLPAGAVHHTSAGVLLETSTTPLVLDVVQPAGKNVMAAADWLRGVPPGVGFRAP